MLKTVWFNSEGINRVDRIINDLETAVLRNDVPALRIAAHTAGTLLLDIRRAWVDVTDLQENSVGKTRA